MKIKTNYGFTDLLLIISLLLFGGFNDYVCAFLSVALSVYLIGKLRKSEQFLIKKDVLSLFFLAIPFVYGITAFWAVDNGMAFIGFIKFMPLGLYALAVWQTEHHEKIINFLPVLSAVITVLSAIAMQFDALKNIFSVQNRLAGTFSYPNTYALFLLVCELIVIQKKRLAVWDYVILAILFGGILYTGSRTVFIALIIFNLLYIFLCAKKRMKIIIASLLALAVAGVAVTAIAFGENSILYRFITVSLTSETFVGRLLYALDALPLLLKYPFGMGYMGYFYCQGSIQSGVYSNLYAHNDFLQLLLDIGFIPALGFIIGLVIWFFKREIPIERKIIIGAICFHTLFDFNLQFISVFMLLVLLSNTETSRPIKIKCNKKVCIPILATVCVLCLYMGVSLGCSYIGLRSLSDKLYPFNTQNKLELLEQTEDINRANTLADEILSYNQQYYVPFSIKAKYFYSTGDFNSFIKYKRSAIERYPLRYSEYSEYCEMLINGIAAYQKAGDYNSANFCKDELLNAKKLFEQSHERVGKLGSMLQNQPWARLPQKIMDYIELIE